MAKKQIPTVVKLSLEDMSESGYHLFLNIKVNGKRCRFLLDTGASKTVIGKEWFEKNIGKEKLKTIKQETSGLHSAVAESYLGKIDLIEFGTLSVKKYNSAAVELSHVNNMYAKYKIKKINGILGSDLLLKLNAIIDYKNATLTLS
ncbi:MAG: clan AA aspartic protease [Chitinophagales bacterium]|nr:clan AA aspartic protease [Chitinophagales bacterium]